MAAEVSNEEVEVDDVPDGLIDIRFSTVRAERLKMFSDAVWSIIATLMVSLWLQIIIVCVGITPD